MGCAAQQAASSNFSLTKEIVEIKYGWKEKKKHSSETKKKKTNGSGGNPPAPLREFLGPLEKMTAPVVVIIIPVGRYTQQFLR